jgi:SAM-dependent methyltransferase
MAHQAQRVFFETVRNVYPELFDSVKVLEVGSLNINGTARDFFTNCDYLGLDIGPGLGVDLVVSGADYDAPDGSFDVTVSAECFEHNPVWRETFANMVRLTKDNGLIIFTCAGEGRPEHGTSASDIGSSPLTVDLGWEYYKNLTPNDFTDEDLSGLTYQFYENGKACDLYFVAKKGPMKHIPIEEVDWDSID